LRGKLLSALRWCKPALATSVACAAVVLLLFDWVPAYIYSPASAFIGSIVLTVFLSGPRDGLRPVRVFVGAAVASLAATATVALLLAVWCLRLGALPSLGEPLLYIDLLLVAHFAGSVALALLVVHTALPVGTRAQATFLGAVAAFVGGCFFVAMEAGDAWFPMVEDISYRELASVGWYVRMILLAVTIGATFSYFLPGPRGAITDPAAGSTSRGRA